LLCDRGVFVVNEQNTHDYCSMLGVLKYH